MSIDNRRPIDAEPTLMNARRKEKKERLQDGLKPRNASEWHDRSQHMLKWFLENPQIRNFLSYGTRFKFTWTEFKSWRKESEEFSKAIDECMQICLERREGFLESKEELTKVYLKEQAIYNPLLGDYEKELRSKEGKVLDDIAAALSDKEKVLKSIK